MTRNKNVILNEGKLFSPFRITYSFFLNIHSLPLMVLMLFYYLIRFPADVRSNIDVTISGGIGKSNIMRISFIDS